MKLYREKLNVSCTLPSLKNVFPLPSFMERITQKVQSILFFNQNEMIEEESAEIDQESFFSLCKMHGYRNLCDENVYIASKHLFKNAEELTVFCTLLRKCEGIEYFGYEKLSLMFSLCQTYEDFFYFFEKKYLLHIFLRLQYKHLLVFQSFGDVHALRDFFRIVPDASSFFSSIGNKKLTCIRKIYGINDAKDLMYFFQEIYLEISFFLMNVEEEVFLFFYRFLELDSPRNFEKRLLGNASFKIFAMKCTMEEVHALIEWFDVKTGKDFLRIFDMIQDEEGTIKFFLHLGKKQKDMLSVIYPTGMDFLKSPNVKVMLKFFSFIGYQPEVFEYIYRFYKTEEEICVLYRKYLEGNVTLSHFFSLFHIQKDSFFILRDICTSKEDFEYILDNKSIVQFIFRSNYQQFVLLLEMYRVRSFQEIKHVFEQGYYKTVFSLSENVIEIVKKLCKNIEDFEYFISRIYLREFLNKVYGKHLDIILFLYDVKDIRQFVSILNKECVQQFLLSEEDMHIFSGMKQLLFTFKAPHEKVLLRNFLEKKVFFSKYSNRYFFGISIPGEERAQYKRMFLHFLTYRQKSFLDFLKNIYVLSGMGIKMNIQQFKTLDDYKENNRIDGKRLMGDVARILEFLQRNNKEKILQNLENALRTKDEKSVFRICMDVVLEYVEVYLERKLYIHIVSHLKKEAKNMGIAWEDIEKEELWKKMKRKEFIEAYKIIQAPMFNKQQGVELLLKYLRGEFERVEECRQYDTVKNRRWMHRYLKGNGKELWLSRMRKEYEVELDGVKRKVIIEKELDPLKIMMMGNRVDGSCLSYYSDKGYYYSVISNAVDVNKGVFYIYDENEKLLGRFLVTIGNDKRITRYPIYYARKIEGVNFDAIVNTYVKEVARDLHMKVNGETTSVSTIESEHWYCDPPVEVE